MAGLDQYTKLLLHMDDNNFIDKCGNTITNNGVTLYTTTKVFGVGCAYFNGSGDLSVTNSNDFEFGTNDFTIDTWINIKTLPTSGTDVIYDKRDTISSSKGIAIGIGTSGNLKLYATSNNTSWDIINYISSEVLSLNQWHHITYIRYGNNFYAGINGVLTYITSSTLSIATNTNNPHIGGLVGSSNKFKGYIDEFRISKGIARWTTNFTPPVSPYCKDIFLIKQNNNYYTINSTNYDNITTHNFIPLTLTGGIIPNKSDIETFGFTDLNALTNSMTINTDTFIPISKFDNTAELKYYK